MFTILRIWGEVVMVSKQLQQVNVIKQWSKKKNHTHTHARALTQAHAHIHACTHAHIHTRARTHTRTHGHARAHTHTHTHTQTPKSTHYTSVYFPVQNFSLVEHRNDCRPLEANVALACSMGYRVFRSTRMSAGESPRAICM